MDIDFTVEALVLLFLFLFSFFLEFGEIHNFDFPQGSSLGVPQLKIKVPKTQNNVFTFLKKNCLFFLFVTRIQEWIGIRTYVLLLITRIQG